MDALDKCGRCLPVRQSRPLNFTEAIGYAGGGIRRAVDDNREQECPAPQLTLIEPHCMTSLVCPFPRTLESVRVTRSPYHDEKQDSSKQQSERADNSRQCRAAAQSEIETGQRDRRS